MKPFSRLSLLLLAGLWILPATVASAQSYDDDDDLYYSPTRAAEQQRRAEAAATAAAEAAGLGSADHYTVVTDRPLNMDVDAYNRRGTVAAPDSSAALITDNFGYTRRIQRFHNPDIIEQAGDTVAEYYYASPSEKDINLYVINNVDPVGGYSPYYNPYSWSYPWNSWNWYAPGWQISFGPMWGGWSWGWGGWYDPFWDYGWGWGPGCGPGWGPGWHRPHPWYPIYGNNWGYNRPGASRPHPRPNGSGTYPGGNYQRPGHSTTAGNWRPGGGSRPGNFGRPGNSGNSSVTPGYTRPGSGSSGYTPSNNDRRGRNNGSGYNTNTNTNTTNRYNTPSHNSGYSRPGNNGGSSGGYRAPGSGSRGGGGGGGYHGGGGGGGSRGRGR